ncbi:MAG: hypothetical protein U0350_43445 [Caldilineaceae bacterium]
MTIDLPELQRTKTHTEKLYSAQAVPFKSWFWRIRKRLAKPIPYADDEKHFIVLEMVKDEPQRTVILTDPQERFKLASKKCDRILLIRVALGADTLAIAARPYKLGNGYELDAAFKLLFQVNDTKQLWLAHKDQDPLKALDSAIQECATNFFGDLTSDDLLGQPLDLLETMRQSTNQYGLKRVRQQVEEEAQRIQIAGLKLLSVTAILALSQGLADHLKTLYTQFYAPGNVLEQVQKKRVDHAQRQAVNALLDKDTTFAPHNLRMVILGLDTNLFEQFYTNDWKTAMDAVHKTLDEKYKAYVELQRTGEIKHLQKWSEAANQFAGLKDDALRKWQQVFLDKMLESRKNQEDWKQPSVQEFLRSLINQGASSAR